MPPNPFLSGISDIVVADRLSNANRVRIRGTSDLQVSWELSHAGMLTCAVPLRDLRQKYGIDHRTLLSKWVYYDHPTAGPWGGIVTDVSADDGIVIVTAESWAACLRGATTAPTIVAPGGGLIATLMYQIDFWSPYTGISRGVVDTNVSINTAVDIIPELSFYSDDQDLYEQYLPSVMQMWFDVFDWRPGLQAAGWNIHPVTRTFSFDSTFGQDLSGRVALRDRLHNISSGWTDDTEDISNRVVLNASYNGYSWSPTLTGTIQSKAYGMASASLGRHGPKTVVMNDDTVYASYNNMVAAATDKATALAKNMQTVTIECADVGNVWAYFREGDFVYADLSNSGVGGKMLVRNRALDVANSTMTVSGEAELMA